jgi:LmbE family N-acetylglucosaminyl deacetylase
MGSKVLSTLKWAGLAGTGLAGLYRYQPQRFFLFPRPLPEYDPPVDPDSEKLFSPKTRVAIVAAHPDDPEFYIGGLLTQLGRSGAKMTVVMCTDGDKGYYPRILTNSTENRRIRKLEQLEAARRYKSGVTFLGFPDGRLQPDPQTVLSIVQKLQAFKPEYVLSFDHVYPPRLQHSDHLAAGKATARALHALPTVKWYLRFSTRAPNHLVDVTQEWASKMELLAVHESQFRGDRLSWITEMVEGRARESGERIGVQYAEGLRCARIGAAAPVVKR